MTDSSHLPESIDAAKFSVVRKGYDKREVREFLQEVEQAFRDMETWTKSAKVRLAEAEERLAGSQTDSDGSVDNAMFAVFDAKDRILDKARRRAEQIEEEALAEAAEIKARAERLSGDGSADDVLAAAREEAQDIIDRAKREAAKLGAIAGSDIDALQHEMEKKDQQLSTMRNQLLESKTGAQVASSGDSEMVVQAQAMADQLIREAQDKADRIVSRAESRAADSGDADAAAASILESAKQQAADVEARAAQIKATAEEVLADAQTKFAAARDAEAAAQLSGGAGTSGISDDALLTGMQGELAEVHEKVEARRSELMELHDLVEERRNELREVHDAVEARKAELDSTPAPVAGGEAGFDLSAVQTEADGIIAKAQEEASQVRADAMRMLAEAEQERAAVGAGSTNDDSERVAALEEEIAALQASQAKAQQQSTAWAEVVDELKEKVTDLNSQLESKDSEIAAAGKADDGEAKQLRAEIKTLVMELAAKDAEMESATVSLRDEGDALAARVAELTDKLESGQDSEHAAANAAEIDALESQLDELRAQLQAKDVELEAASNTLREEADSLATRVADLTAELEAKDQEIAAAVSTGEAAAGLEKKVAELTARIEVKDEELAAASGTAAKVPELEGQLAELSSQLTAKDEALASATATGERAQELETQVADLSSQLQSKSAESDQTIASLREESEALAARVGELNSNLETKTSDIEAMKAEIEDKNAQLATAAEAADKIASLEERATDLSAQLEAKSSELESTSAAMREESSALAARVAELADAIEANRTAHDTALARAARVDPLSQELTKAQVTLREQRAQIEKVAEIGSVAQELRSRIEGLEADLAESRAEATELPKLRVQVDGLKARAAKAEEAAEFANSQLTDLLAQADNFEQDAIRRAAAAEAHRIREMTEDSLGIAREATAGTGIDGDDYVPAATFEPVEVTSDPDDWSDVFGAADAITARLAGKDPSESIDAELAATRETEFDAEDVALVEPGEFAAPTAPEADGTTETVDEAIADPEPDESAPEDSQDEAEVVESESAETEQAEPELTAQAEDSGSDADTVEMELSDADLETSSSDVADVEAIATEDVATEVAEHVADDDPEPEEFANIMEAVEDVQAFDEFEPDDTVAEDGTGELVVDEAAAVEEEPIAEDELVAAVEPIVGEEPVAVEAAVVEELVEAVDVQESTVSEDDLPHDDESSGVEDVVDDATPEQLHPDAPAADVISGEQNIEAAITDEVAAESTQSANDQEEEAEVVPIGMAERLRLARAELEAELDPETLPAQDIPAASVEPQAEADPVEAPPQPDLPEEPALSAVADEGADTAQGRSPARETRYARQSAKLPRITESDTEDADDLSSMSRFRARMLRGKNKDSD
ncbi:MAG: DivIVA domain-containing protein [Acidimicrobiia bacterium]|nr:DivIVA domain-containing protein [Acidimicrobiia bacterium]